MKLQMEVFLLHNYSENNRTKLQMEVFLLHNYSENNRGDGGGDGGFCLACEDFGENVRLFIPCLSFSFFSLQ